MNVQIDDKYFENYSFHFNLSHTLIKERFFLANLCKVSLRGKEKEILIIKEEFTDSSNQSINPH